MRAVLITLGLFAILAIFATVRQSRAFRRLALSRAGVGFAEFSGALPGVPEEIQRNVFEYVQKNWILGIDQFPVRAEDSFDVYPLDEGQLEDSIYELANACGKEKPMLNVWKGQPLLTVGDIARLIAHLPTPEEVRVEGTRRLWTDQ